jgi:L-glyceraldehyde 3-phosphate reductase
MPFPPAADRYDSMVYRRCGRSGLLRPAVSLGLWNNFGTFHSHENARSLVQTAFNLGITHFDLANNYRPPPGSAEATFGRILTQDLGAWRDELVISTKAGCADRGRNAYSVLNWRSPASPRPGQI